MIGVNKRLIAVIFKATFIHEHMVPFYLSHFFEKKDNVIALTSHFPGRFLFFKYIISADTWPECEMSFSYDERNVYCNNNYCDNIDEFRNGTDQDYQLCY